MNSPQFLKSRLRFILTSIIGCSFFLFPFRFQEKLTVPFDVMVTYLRENYFNASSLYTLFVVSCGMILSVIAYRDSPFLGLKPVLQDFKTTRIILFLRIVGFFFSVTFYLNWVPPFVRSAGINVLIWNTLAVAVALIIPLGAIIVQLFVTYGTMEFIGVLAQPVMRPLFHLPGRAALDALTSWVGSYSVGLYITRIVYLQGGYHRRHVFILATCFSTVSMGFVGVVVATLNLLHLFPIIFLCYLLSIALLAMLLVRLPPISKIPQTYSSGICSPVSTYPELNSDGLWAKAWCVAINQAEKAPPVLETVSRGLANGLRLAACILGTIVSVGTLALITARYTSIFQYLGMPLVPILKFLNLPSPEILAPAVLVEVTEMYIPALLVVGLSESARFFIAVLSISQLIFFSSLGPMIIDMFQDIPIKATQLIQLFGLRTLLLIPFLTLVIKLLEYVGILN